jgi:hypothetical protein
MNDYYDAEEKRVNSSFTSQADKERELAKTISTKRSRAKENRPRKTNAADRKASASAKGIRCG